MPSEEQAWEALGHLLMYIPRKGGYDVCQLCGKPFEGRHDANCSVQVLRDYLRQTAPKRP